MEITDFYEAELKMYEKQEGEDINEHSKNTTSVTIREEIDEVSQRTAEVNLSLVIQNAGTKGNKIQFESPVTEQEAANASDDSGDLELSDIAS